MNTELSAIMATDGKLVEWSQKITYNADLSSEDKEISAVLDNWAKEVGRTGHDRDHEISQMVMKAITPETVDASSELVDAIFDKASIGEFDDYREEVAPKNTVKVYDAMAGGNVDRSFVDHKILTPTWSSLQAETDIRLSDMRRGGYKTVANMLNHINEALEFEKIARAISKIDDAIGSGHAGYVTESTANVTEASADALALYLMDVSNGDAPRMFALNKYIQKIASFDKAQKFATDGIKNQFNTNGFLSEYAGCLLTGLSGQKKNPSGKLMIPD